MNDINKYECICGEKFRCRFNYNLHIKQCEKYDDDNENNKRTSSHKDKQNENRE